jgi:hypothetical protein
MDCLVDPRQASGSLWCSLRTTSPDVEDLLFGAHIIKSIAQFFFSVVNMTNSESSRSFDQTSTIGGVHTCAVKKTDKTRNLKLVFD